MMDRMMDGMGGTMWGAVLLWLLLIVVLVLAAAALSNTFDLTRRDNRAERGGSPVSFLCS